MWLGSPLTWNLFGRYFVQHLIELNLNCILGSSSTTGSTYTIRLNKHKIKTLNRFEIYAPFIFIPAKLAAAIPRRCFASIAPDKPRPNPKSTVRLELQFNWNWKQKKKTVIVSWINRAVYQQVSFITASIEWKLEWKNRSQFNAQSKQRKNANCALDFPVFTLAISISFEEGEKNVKSLPFFTPNYPSKISMLNHKQPFQRLNSWKW